MSSDGEFCGTNEVCVSQDPRAPMKPGANSSDVRWTGGKNDKQ